MGALVGFSGTCLMTDKSFGHFGKLGLISILNFHDHKNYVGSLLENANS